MDINLAIAKNVKRVREQKKLTLDAAASITGVSRSMLIQIEKGDVNPTITMVWKIATGYKVSFTSLIEDTAQEDTLIPCRDPFTEDIGRYKNYPTFPFDEQRLFEMYRIVIEVSGHLDAQPHLADSEEYITVFQGSMEIVLGDKSYQLHTGDSLRFKADQKHSYKNIGNKEALISMLIYYA